MFGKLLPRSAPYFTYFKEQNAIMRQMAEMLVSLINAERNAEESIKLMARLEDDADKLHRQIIQELGQTFITPIDREDIYAISTGQERVIDSLHGLGTRFYLFSFIHVRFPAQKMVFTLIDITRALDEMLDCLEDHTPPFEAARKIQVLKETCDMLLGVGLGELQDTEVRNFDHIKQLMAWSQLYDRIEQSVLVLADLADTLEQAVLKYA